MQTYRRIVIIIATLVCTVAVFAFAQMTQYVPSSSGGAGGGSTSGAGTTGGSTGSSGSGSGSTEGSTTGGSAEGTSSSDSSDGSSTTGSGTEGTSSSDSSDGSSTTGSGTEGTSSVAESNSQTGSDNSSSNDWYGYAEDFQNQLDGIDKKPKKRKKQYLGIPGFDGPDIKRFPFWGSALGASWRLGGTATDPIAQGTLTGKGWRMGIRIGLYTGSVYAGFLGNKDHWVANYYSESGAQRSDLYDGKRTIYQEEISADADGNPYNLGLLLTGNTFFGIYEGGSFFIVDEGAMPDAISAGGMIVSIPRGIRHAIPTEKIIELLERSLISVRNMLVNVAHAALQSSTLSQIFDRLNAYKKVMADMQSIEKIFAALDFNDPNLDYDAVQDLIDAYDVGQKKLDYLVIQLGRALLFVRGGDWLSTAGDAAYVLMDGGVDFLPATLVSQVPGPFDFYTIQTVKGIDKLFAGTCTGKNDWATGEQVTCTLRKPTAAQSKAVLKANEAYLTLVSQAHDALGSIEFFLFAPS